MNYNTQLCNTAWGKNYWRKLRSVRVFSKNCASNFFRSVGQEWPLKFKTSFYQRTEDVLFNENVISEMKQTKT
ncbi:hypothetical protein SAMN05443549_1112 [Flavobacterium fluvii]|uniref:Uncharacterized protein n=1 Tax=Flavobacterium fluvii TaxID=468056 RepID=A0A1M5PJ48_9FLAO|nr:hypothetical protein SAMN05443549_1112 [Flavobacterium fluvii]